MKSLQKRFNNATKRNPFHSSYQCFWLAIVNQKFSKKIILFWFNRLVEKDDYSKKVKNELISQLVLISNPSEEGMKQV